VDGFSATDFHRRCDFKGPCVVVGYTDCGFRFGGFSPEGYRSTDDYYDTLDAFLFYWPNDELALAAPAEATEASPPLPVLLPLVGRRRRRGTSSPRRRHRQRLHAALSPLHALTSLPPAASQESTRAQRHRGSLSARRWLIARRDASRCHSRPAAAA